MLAHLLHRERTTPNGDNAMYKRIHVIVNPAAGRDVPILGTLNKVFAESGVDWDIFVTKEAGDAYRLGKEAVATRADAGGVSGGDGTRADDAHGGCWR